MQTYRCHQVPYHPFKNSKGLHIVVKWEHASRNVGLQHKVLIHYGELNVIIRIEPKYGRAKMTCHL
jgi:hypothetical protein